MTNRELAEEAAREILGYSGNPRVSIIIERALDKAQKRPTEGQCQHGWRGSVPEDGQRIVTPCPACGAQSLFIGKGGHLTCARVPSDTGRGCDNPSVEQAVDDLKRALATAEARAYERAAGVAHEWATKHLVHKEPEYPYHPVDGYYNPAQAAEQIEKAIRALSPAPVEKEKL